ncbi:hypothetical protein T439DRAFT_378713 [Meredithblackwellia eburnea MCA 4105]
MRTPFILAVLALALPQFTQAQGNGVNPSAGGASQTSGSGVDSTSAILSAAQSASSAAASMASSMAGNVTSTGSASMSVASSIASVGAASGSKAASSVASAISSGLASATAKSTAGRVDHAVGWAGIVGAGVAALGLL